MFAKYQGVLRSLLIYYGIPWRQLQMRRLYRQFIQPGDICFDIGAHVGNRVWAWLALGAKVVAVEPQPHLLRLLRLLYGRNGRVALLDEAIGALAGEAQLFVSERHPTVTTLSESWITAVSQDESFAEVDWNETVTVPVTTLDALIATHGLPAFCKIDVEGHELAVLQGLTQPIPALSVEYVPAAVTVTQDCLCYLHDLGDYRFNWSPGEKQQLQEGEWLTVEAMLARLPTMVENGRSGDIYARLQTGVVNDDRFCLPVAGE